MRHVFSLLVFMACGAHAPAAPPQKPAAGSLGEAVQRLPTLREVRAIEKRMEAIAPALYLLGSPQHGVSGTAFCISRKHRLLVTTAHVVDPKKQRHRLSVMDNEGRMQRIQSIWLHPDILRTNAAGTPVPSDQGGTSEILPSSPDVAFIQLSPTDPEPRMELRLAPPGAGERLLGHAVGVPAFSSFQQPAWPLVDEKPTADHAWGCVAALQNVQTANAERPTRPWQLFLAVPTWEGASGAPVLTEDGTVIGVANGTALFREPGQPSRFVSTGILADAAWDLLSIAEDLQQPLRPDRDAGTAQKPVDRETLSPPVPSEVQRKALTDARRLRRAGSLAEAVEPLNRLCKECPLWWEPFAERAAVWDARLEFWWKQGKSAPADEEETYTRWIFEDTHAALQRNPSDLGRHISLGYAICGLAIITHRKEYARAADDFCSRRLVPSVTDKEVWATFYALRA